MIKASNFSLNCGMPILDSIATMKPPTGSQVPEQLSFLKGDPKSYGHKDVHIPESCYEIVRKAIAEPKNHSYCNSMGIPEAREAVAKHFGVQNETTVNDVIITHGANMGLYITLLSICNEGDNICVPEPSYPFFHKTAPALGINVKKYKLMADKNWEIDLNYLETLIDNKTKFIWIVNPSNPCGSVFSVEHIMDIFKLAKKHKKLIVSDEVYWDEGFKNNTHRSLGHLAGDQPVIVISGMEKNFMVPGWSISWIIFFDRLGSLKDIKGAMNTSCQIFLHPNSFLMKSLGPVLEELGSGFTQKLMPIFEENHNYLSEKLKNIRGIKPIQAQGTFYQSSIIELDQFEGFKSDFEFLQKLLEEQNVWILNLSSFGGGFQGFRLQTCSTKESYDELIVRLTAFCNKYYKK